MHSTISYLGTSGVIQFTELGTTEPYTLFVIGHSDETNTWKNVNETVLLTRHFFTSKMT